MYSSNIAVAAGEAPGRRRAMTRQQPVEHPLVHHVAQRLVGVAHRLLHLVTGRGRRHQRVERNLVHVELEQQVDVVVEHRERLPGQVEDHVDVQRREHAARRRETSADLGAAAVLLEPVHPGQQPVVETLHADRAARHAGIAVADQHLGLEMVRVGLDRDRLHRRQRRGSRAAWRAVRPGSRWACRRPRTRR